MFIYAYYDQGCGEIQLLKFETQDEALQKITVDLKEWVPWMEEVYEGTDESVWKLNISDMISEIVDQIRELGKYDGLYGESDCFSISLKEFN